MDVLHDPITHAMRLAAPGRDARLAHVANVCPFCPEAQDDTPATLDEVPRRAHLDDDIGGSWSARSFANRFPLTPEHEVLVPTPRHALRWSELTLPELAAGFELLLRRVRALERDGDYVHAFVNDGAAAGASLPHVHAQLVRIRRSEHVERLSAGVRGADCWLCTLTGGGHEALVVERGPRLQLAAHPLPRLGGGLLVAPRAHDVVVDDACVQELAALVHRALQATRDAPGCNLWLVQDAVRGGHWYLEVQPRRTNVAGLELALGITVVSRDSRRTAAEARERLGLAPR